MLLYIYPHLSRELLWPHPIGQGSPIRFPQGPNYVWGIPPSVSLGRSSMHVPLGGDPLADQRPNGRITSPHWPGNASGSPRRECMKLLGIGKSGNLSWNYYPCDSIPDKWLKMDGRMDDKQQCLVAYHQSEINAQTRVLLHHLWDIGIQLNCSGGHIVRNLRGRGSEPGATRKVPTRLIWPTGRQLNIHELDWLFFIGVCSKFWLFLHFICICTCIFAFAFTIYWLFWFVCLHFQLFSMSSS